MVAIKHAPRANLRGSPHHFVVHVTVGHGHLVNWGGTVILERSRFEFAQALRFQPLLSTRIVFMVAYHTRTALAVIVAVTMALCALLANAMLPALVHGGGSLSNTTSLNLFSGAKTSTEILASSFGGNEVDSC